MENPVYKCCLLVRNTIASLSMDSITMGLYFVFELSALLKIRKIYYNLHAIEYRPIVPAFESQETRWI
jgi:hypothetical protein